MNRIDKINTVAGLKAWNAVGVPRNSVMNEILSLCTKW
jgi:hypothetical protein